MKIRKATLKDLKEIDRIYVEGSIDEGKLQFSNISEKEMIEHLKKYKRERLEGFRKEIKDFDKNYWIVSEINGKIASFAQGRIGAHIFPKKEKIGFVEKVYIDKTFRKKGIETILTKEIIKWLRKKKVKYIESRFFWKNKPSKKLHEKLGFKPISLEVRLK